jgi:anti-sigma factor RsiW
MAMTSDDKRGPPDHDSFDRAMRDLHAQALIQVSPRTRARLRAARATTIQGAPMRGLRWAAATAFAAVAALAIGLLWQGPDATTDSPTQTASRDAANYGAIATLDENPDLYLWLASNDDTLPPALER